MKRREFLAGSCGFAGAGALAQLGIASHARATDPLKVGILIPMSGPAGLFGPSSRNCAQLAVEKINAAGGILGRPIEPIYTDVGVPPAEAAQTALKLWKGQKAEAFIGMHDSAVRGALLNVFKGQVPYIYTAVYEGGACAPGLYVIGETPTQQLQPVIPWLAANKNTRKWYLIGNDYNWPRDTNAAAKGYISASGGDVVGEEYLPFTVDNFDSSLAKIKESEADAVLITLVGGASVGFNKSFASFGMSNQALRLGTLIEENTLAGIGSESSQGLFSSAGYFAALDTPAAVSFAKEYEAAYGASAPQLNTLGQSCYNGILLLEALANKANSLKVADLDAVAEGVSYESPRGKATMEKRHVASDIHLAEAKGASFEVVETFKNTSSGSTCI